MDKHVLVGKIVNTRGLKGEVKVFNYSDFPLLRYKKGNRVDIYDESNDTYINLEIEKFISDPKFVYLKFKDIDSIEEVLVYKDKYIVKKEDELEKLEEDTYYYKDFVGLKVIYNEKEIGEVVDIFDNGNQSVLRIKTNDTTILVLFIEDFVENVDIENNKITLKNLEGLLWR